jgi:CRP-like cAMP-binding protein/small-conductance mechanosensitive channel
MRGIRSRATHAAWSLLVGIVAWLQPATAHATAPNETARAVEHVQIHIVPWHIAALAGAMIVTAALLRRFVPQRRKRIRSTAILFGVYLLAMLGGAAFTLLHWSTRAEQFWTVSELLETFITINIASLLLFDLMLNAVRVRPSVIVTDLVIGAGYVVAMLHEMHRAHFDPTGIVTTGAVVSGVLSISLAPTLGNILGGVALQLDNSVREGDWIQLDANTQGKIKAIHWRHTVVETRNWDTIIVPNVTLLASNITILGKRTDQPLQRRYWIYFNIDFRYHPAQVIAAVNEALQASPIPNVAREPKPHVICYDFAKDGRDSMGYYAARYWLTDLAVDDPTNSAIRERIYSALQRANIPLALPATTVFVSRDDEQHAHAKRQREHARRVELLSKLSLFQDFTAEEIEHLADRLVFAPFARGEVMTRQGNVAHWLYILAAGEADIVLKHDDDEEKKIATIKGPDFFGEMAVMTGEPRAATVIANCACDCYRLDKEAFKKIMTERKELASIVSTVLVARRHEMQLVHFSKDEEHKHRQLADMRARLVGEIQSFFGLN